MTSTSAQLARARDIRTPGFGASLISEWTKLWSVRSTYISLLLAIVLAAGFTALIGAAVGSNWDSVSAAERATFDPTATSFAGTLMSTILFAVLGVTAVSSEYASGMIRLTLMATPRRGRVLAAKAVAVAAVTLVAGLVVAAATFAAGQVMFDRYGVPSARLGDPGVLRAVLAVGIAAPTVPLLGLALAFLLRSTAAAITTILAAIFVPAIFGQLLPAWWQEHVLRYLPNAAGNSLSTVHPAPDALTHLAPGPAGAVLAAWLAVALAAAYVTLVRRDA